MLNKLLLSEALCRVSVEVPLSDPPPSEKAAWFKMIGLTIEGETLRIAGGVPLLICCDDVPSLPTSAPLPQAQHSHP